MFDLSGLTSPRSPSFCWHTQFVRNLLQRETQVWYFFVHFCANMSEKQWLPLESNPDVLTSFGRALGLPDTVTFCDVWSLDLLDMVPSPRYAILLLFPLTERTLRVIDTSSSAQSSSTSTSATATSQPFFCKQTIGNACGTIALLHAALNSGLVMKPDSFLHDFYQTTASLSPDQRAQALQSDQGLDQVHDQFAQVCRPQFLHSLKKKKKRIVDIRAYCRT